MKTSVSRFFDFNRDLVNKFCRFLVKKTIFPIMARATLEAILVLLSMWIIKNVAHYLFPNVEWFTKAIEMISHIMAIVIFAISCIKDLTSYWRGK